MNKFSILSNAGWTRHGFVNRNIILGPPQNVICGHRKSTQSRGRQVIQLACLFHSLLGVLVTVLNPYDIRSKGTMNN